VDAGFSPKARATKNLDRAAILTDRRAVQSMMRSSRIACVVIASKAKQSRLGDCGGGLDWIASLSLAMTAEGAST
jgi:hypothetical protein